MSRCQPVRPLTQGPHIRNTFKFPIEIKIGKNDNLGRSDNNKTYRKGEAERREFKESEKSRQKNEISKGGKFLTEVLKT